MRFRLNFITLIFIISLARMVDEVIPQVWPLVSSFGKAPCEEGTQTALIPQADREGYMRKAVCPRTEPAHFLDLEIETQLYLVTGYAVDDGHTPGEITADGRKVRPGITVACPEELTLGTMILIEDLGPRVCEDRGSAIVGKRLDVAFETSAEAIQFGKRWRRVAVIR